MGMNDAYVWLLKLEVLIQKALNCHHVFHYFSEMLPSQCIPLYLEKEVGLVQSVPFIFPIDNI